jgi:ribosome-binding protein aMBF1 (putative translation factor)
MTSKKKTIAATLTLFREVRSIVEANGNCLKEARRDRAITQKEIAYAVGVKASYICDLEAGRIMCSPELAKRIERFIFERDYDE